MKPDDLGKARLESSWGIAVPVFAGTPKVKRDPKRFTMLVHEARYTSATLTISHPEHVGVPHETLLLGILRLAEKGHPELFGPNTFLRDVDGVALIRDFIRLEVSAHELLKAAGLSDGAVNYDRLERHLDDLSRIHLKVKGVTTMGASTILGYFWDRENGDKVRINLCWRFAAVLTGNAMYGTIDLNERQALPSDVAKTLHRWISSHRWEGKSQSYDLATLVDKAWRDTATGSAMRMRKSSVLRALHDIGKLQDWDIRIDGDKVIVTRR